MHGYSWELQWKNTVKDAVNTYWRDQILQQSSLYDQLRYINTDCYKPGTIHPLVKTQTNSMREVRRIAVKIKLVTGTYLLQTVRAKFQGNSKCLLCKEAEETLHHFLFECCILSSVRDLIMQDIQDSLSELCSRTLSDFTPEQSVAILLDATILCRELKDYDEIILSRIEQHTRRLCFILHQERHKLVLHQSKRKRSGQCTWMH